MSECILSNQQLENATRLIKIAIEHFPMPKSFSKEDEEKFIDSLLKSLDELKRNTIELDEIKEKQFWEKLKSDPDWNSCMYHMDD